MNSIIERINFTDGAYWGDPGKFKFRATIDSFQDASEMAKTSLDSGAAQSKLIELIELSNKMD